MNIGTIIDQKKRVSFSGLKISGCVNGGYLNFHGQGEGRDRSPIQSGKTHEILIRHVHGNEIQRDQTHFSQGIEILITSLKSYIIIIMIWLEQMLKTNLKVLK